MAARLAPRTADSGHKLIVYHMQKPKSTVFDNKDKIPSLLDTLDTVFKGVHDLPQGKTPIDITVTMT